MLDISVPQNLVDELRAAFLKELATKDDDFAHPVDIEKIKNNDQWVKRFLAHHDLNVQLALTMMFETCQWRKENNVNEISESNVRMDYLVDGGCFSRCRDKDGHKLLVLNCKKHTKGSKNMDELKREENGKGISIFFDLEGCGLSNLDLDLTRYLISLFKQYYPYFLNYIIIYEMAWILNAAFKLIKSWLPPKAVERIKLIKKAEIGNWVPLNNALKCWGGEDDYVFSFQPEERDNNNTATNNNAANRKVHFADPSPMSESPGAAGDKENDSSNKLLSVNPANTITFVKDGNELVSTLELQNIDPNTSISYKMKTTSPEKFRVKPSAGCLAPGEKTTVSVTLLQGFQLRGLSKDKFLLMSMPIDTTELSHQQLTDLWKNVSNKNVSQHRLRCAQIEAINRNGNAVMVGGDDADDAHYKQLTTNINTLMDCQAKLHKAVDRTQFLQWVLIGVTILFSIAVIYIVKSEIKSINVEQSTCYRGNDL
ncbi:motile sperm domain-containing protein 2 [Holotrichia oblita]|uniref:Motile sperm domain-containing protein 2 n=1 Tax=Holotrichia oblita TaxID=644536 RepID=A0ACB9TY52_HOLOL|nr:motile sperm domain-containing protein 2 [Holotrichia oblita]